jgi:outer membrane lipoprotein carrier protein
VRTALAALVVCASASAFADRAVLDRIDAAARETHTLATSFVQTNRMKLFKQELKSEGKLYFASPRKIRWEYTAPDPSVLLLDGNKATMRAPGGEAQVFDLEKDPTLRAVFDQLLTFVGGGSIASAESAYAIETNGPTKAPHVVLTPKPDTPVAKTFSRIELTFDDKSQVRDIHLVEKNGDEKTIKFTKIERNKALPKNAFD